MSKISPVVISGSIAIDRIMSFGGRYREHIVPEALDSLSISIFLDELTDAHGGVGANIAYTMALLGDEPILVGSVGKDALLYLEKLAHHGVNITHVFESKLPTAAFNVITDADQNQVGGFYPGAMFDSDTLSFEPFKDKSPIAVVAPHDPRAMKRQVTEAKQFGLRLCYDIGQQVSNLSGDDIREGVEAADLLILNEYEISVVAKKTNLQIEQIKAKVPIVVTTLGKNGSIIEGKDVPEPIKIGIVQPDKIADPTGAGDAYRAGFLYALARDWPLKTAGQLGAAAAAYAVETAGTQNHEFSLDDIKTRYQQTFNEELPAVDG